MRVVDFIIERKSGSIDIYKPMERFFESVINVDEKFNIFITLTSDFVIETNSNGLLSGIPIAIKDNIVTKGLRTTCASKVLENYVPSYDATVVKRIKAEGGLIVGKTNMDEFAMGALGTTSAFGPTLNPLNPSFSPGGSSSGSAAAVAIGIVPLALGSDTGGSVRLPAAWTGIYGLKPTYGLISRYGLISYSDSMDQIGPMTKSIFDLELLFGILMGRDESDPTTYDRHISREVFIKRAFRNPSPDILKGMRIALIKNSITHPERDQMVIDRFLRYIDKMKSEGAIIEEVQIPSFEKAPQVYYIIAFSDASSNLARYMGTLYGMRRTDVDKAYMDEYFSLNRTFFGWEVKRRIILGSFILSSGYYDMYYDRALRARAKIADEVMRILEKYDLIITPGSNISPLPIDFDASDLSRLNAIDAPLVIANLTGLPALIVPLETAPFPPISMQLISHKWSEDILFEVGKFIALNISKIEGEVKS